MVCIIDDREDVWKFAPNLITVKKYVYFQGTGDINAPPGSREPPARKKGGQLPSSPQRNISICFTVSSASHLPCDCSEFRTHFVAAGCISVLQRPLCLCYTKRHDIIVSVS